MKIIEQISGSDKIVELELSKDDLDIIDAIIPAPFGEMNRVPGLEWLNQEKVEADKEYLIKHKDDSEIKVDYGFLARLGFGFKASCEMQTITNIEWKDAMELYGRLFHAAHSSLSDYPPIKSEFKQQS